MVFSNQDVLLLELVQSHKGTMQLEENGTVLIVSEEDEETGTPTQVK